MTVWYVARGAGLAALLLLTVSTCVGAAMSRRGRLAGTAALRRRYVVQYLHRVTAGLGLTALALHVSAILIDPDAGVGWRGAMVPFTAGYRPTGVALGTLAAYTFLVAAVLGFARGRLAAAPVGARVWRALHCLAYAGWGSAMWHGFVTGTDSTVGWVRLLYLGCAAAVTACVAVRLLHAGRAGQPRVGTRIDRRLPDRSTGREPAATLLGASR